MRTPADHFMPPPDHVADFARVNADLAAMGVTPARGDEPGLHPDILAAMQQPGNRMRHALLLFVRADLPGQCYAVRPVDDDGWQWQIVRLKQGEAAPDDWLAMEKVPSF
jgi:hypothetical protein